MTEQSSAPIPDHSDASSALITDQQIAQHLHAIEAVLEDKKAIDLVSIDLRDKSTMADFFIVCSGNSKPHTRALAEAAHQYVKEQGLQIYSVEGKHEGSWVLLDVGFLVVHVMQQSLREFYNLEQLWSHAQQKNA